MSEKEIKKRGRPNLKRDRRLGFRVNSINADHIGAQSSNPRFGNSTNYLNWLIEQDRSGRDAALKSVESRLEKIVDRLKDELRWIRVNVSTENAFIHAFTKMYLANHPEADNDTKLLARTTAKGRYQRLLEQAAILMTYDEDQSEGTIEYEPDIEEDADGE